MEKSETIESRKMLMSRPQVSAEDLRTIAAFRNFSPEQLRALASVMTRRRYAPGQLIFLEGDPSRGMWFILRGRARILKHSPDGRAQGLCIASAGKCFGSCPLFDGDTNPANAQALDELEMVALPSEELERLMARDGELMGALLQVFSERLALLAWLGERLGSWPVAERLNECLLRYARQSSSGKVVELTHEELAVMVGTAREVVSRHLARLEKRGLIDAQPGRITLLDETALLVEPCLAARIAERVGSGP